MRVGGKMVSAYDALSNEMRRSIPVTSRRRGLKIHRNTFLGTDAVKFLLNGGYAVDVTDAVLLGRRMVREGFFRHLTNEHDFKNEALLYRFREDDQDVLPLGKVFAADIGELEALEIVELMKSNLNVRDRWKNMRRCRRTFVGVEAVDLLIRTGIAGSTDEALSVGQALLEEGYFCHVTNDKPFENNNQLYRFADDWQADDNLEMEVMVRKAQNELYFRTVRLYGKYYRGFDGLDLLRWMIDNGFVVDDDEAEEIARYWLCTGVLNDPTGKLKFRREGYYSVSPPTRENVFSQGNSKNSMGPHSKRMDQPTKSGKHGREILSQKRSIAVIRQKLEAVAQEQDPNNMSQSGFLHSMSTLPVPRSGADGPNSQSMRLSERLRQSCTFNCLDGERASDSPFHRNVSTVSNAVSSRELPVCDNSASTANLPGDLGKSTANLSTAQLESQVPSVKHLRYGGITPVPSLQGGLASRGPRVVAR